MATKQGMVLEAGDGWAIVLFPGGEYKRIRTREHLQIGQLYQAKSNNVFKYTSAAAIFLIIVLASIDFFSVTARANISPGINLGLNRWNRVVSVDTSNTEVKASIDDLNLNGKSLDQAVNLILKEHNRKSDLANGNKEPANHEFSVSLSVENKKDKKKQDKLLNIIDTTLKESAAKNKGKSSDVKVIRKGNKVTIIDGHVEGQVSHRKSSHDQMNGKVDPKIKTKENKGQDKARDSSKNRPEEYNQNSVLKEHKSKDNIKEKEPNDDSILKGPKLKDNSKGKELNDISILKEPKLKGNTKEKKSDDDSVFKESKLQGNAIKSNNNSNTPTTPQKPEQNSNKNDKLKGKSHPNKYKGNGYED